MAERAAAWWDSQGSARPLLANVICFLSIQVPCCRQNNASQIPWKCLMLFCLCIKSKNPFTWTAAHSPKSRGSILFTINTYPTFSRRNMFPFQDTRHLFVSVLGNYYTSLVICPHILSLCISSDITWERWAALKIPTECRWNIQECFDTISLLIIYLEWNKGHLKQPHLFPKLPPVLTLASVPHPYFWPRACICVSVTMAGLRGSANIGILGLVLLCKRQMN